MKLQYDWQWEIPPQKAMKPAECHQTIFLVRGWGLGMRLHVLVTYQILAYYVNETQIISCNGNLKISDENVNKMWASLFVHA